MTFYVLSPIMDLHNFFFFLYTLSFLFVSGLPYIHANLSSKLLTNSPLLLFTSLYAVSVKFS